MVKYKTTVKDYTQETANKIAAIAKNIKSRIATLNVRVLKEGQRPDPRLAATLEELQANTADLQQVIEIAWKTAGILAESYSNVGKLYRQNATGDKGGIEEAVRNIIVEHITVDDNILEKCCDTIIYSTPSLTNSQRILLVSSAFTEEAEDYFNVARLLEIPLLEAKEIVKQIRNKYAKIKNEQHKIEAKENK